MGTSPPMAMPWTKRIAMNGSGEVHRVRARLQMPDSAMQPAMTFTRPIRSASLPEASAPISMPIEPTVIRAVTCVVPRCHSSRRSGRAYAIRSWSNASKKVTAPTTSRTITCQRHSGRRSKRAPMEAASAAESSCRPGVARAASSVMGVFSGPGHTARRSNRVPGGDECWRGAARTRRERAGRAVPPVPVM